MSNENDQRYHISLQPGSALEVTPVVSLLFGKGSFYLTGDVYIGSTEVTLIRGFGVQNSEVGTVEEAEGTDMLAVVYRHKKSKENTIYYYADTGEIQIIDISVIPIHDHSSVVMGGPAYGTYYTNHEEE